MLSFINKNLQAVQNQIFNQIKSSLNANTAANLLFNAIDKQYGNSKQGLQYMKSLQKFVKEARQDLPQETPIQNLIDGIAELIDTTVYKLVNLK